LHNFFLAHFVILLVAGKENIFATNYLKWMSLVPLFIALNMMNVMELLLSKKNSILFYIGIVILCFAFVSTLTLLQFDPKWYGLFPLLVESGCFLLYHNYIKRIVYH